MPVLLENFTLNKPKSIVHKNLLAILIKRLRANLCPIELSKKKFHLELSPRG